MTKHTGERGIYRGSLKKGTLQVDKNNVSAVILTRNEEAMLPGCLAGLGWADEILVLDSGSTDKTCEIAEAAGAKVFRRDFDNFSNQFNHGIEMAAGPWIFIFQVVKVQTFAFRRNSFSRWFRL